MIEDMRLHGSNWFHFFPLGCFSCLRPADLNLNVANRLFLVSDAPQRLQVLCSRWIGWVITVPGSYRGDGSGGSATVSPTSMCTRTTLVTAGEHPPPFCPPVCKARFPCPTLDRYALCMQFHGPFDPLFRRNVQELDPHAVVEL
jgi:hypothetical protein